MIGMLFVMLFLVGILPTKAHAEGWVQEENGSWYYLNSNGSMVTGWVKVSGKWYYLKSNGAMVTGWQKIRSCW